MAEQQSPQVQQCPNGHTGTRKRFVPRRDFTVIECVECNVSIDIKPGDVA